MNPLEQLAKLIKQQIEVVQKEADYAALLHDKEFTDMSLTSDADEANEYLYAMEMSTEETEVS